VQRVKLSRTHIVVVLLNRVNLYSFASPPEKLAEFETANNPFGLCCLGKRVFAFPGRTPGQVQLVELANRNVSIIPAHSSPLKALALSPDGEILATASENVNDAFPACPCNEKPRLTKILPFYRVR
jgi:WD repeat-containing protein 45